MKVLMFSRLYWPHGGGVERHVAEVSRVLRKKGYEVTVVTEQYSPELPLEEVHEGVKIVRVPYFALQSKRKLWWWMEGWWREVRKVREVHEVSKAQKFNDDELVVHVHDVFWWVLPIKLLQPRLKIHTTFHGYEGSDLPSWKAIFWRRVASRLSAKTLGIGAFMEKWYGVELDKTSYGGSDIANERIKVQHRKEILTSKTPQDDNTFIRIAFVGRLSEDVGILVYLRALRQINTAQSSKFKVNRVDVYGDGEQRQEAEAFVNKHRMPVKFYGWVEDVVQPIKAADIVFVSRYLGILEAMQLGKLVVAVYNNEIKKDYLECHPMAENMVIAGSAEEIVERLGELSAAEVEKMTGRARAWAKEQTWENLANLYEQAWS